MNKFFRLFYLEIAIVTVIIITSLVIKNTKLYLASIVALIILINFYRPYNGTIRSTDDEIISPCQGRIIDITKSGKYITIHFYLNIFDIHEQYMPMSGQIVSQKAQMGHFKEAYLPNAIDNKKLVTVVNTKIGIIKVEQISGKLARTILSYVAPQRYYKKGDAMGYIKLGSRVTLSLPLSRVNICKKIGEKVDIGDIVAKIKLKQFF